MERGFLGGSEVKNPPYNTRDSGLIPSWDPELWNQLPLEEGMATHSSILAREILWTEEPSRL